MAETVQSDDSLDEHADRLWLARAVASPDAWRLRATNSAGLLSAAAAATVAGLIFRDRPVSDEAQLYGRVAVVFYVLAVILYLVAGVWPSPKRDDESRALADDLWEYCREEARPIKWMIAFATIAAVGAIASTGLTLAAVADDQSSSTSRVRVSITDPDVAEGLVSVCPALGPTFDGYAENRGNGRVRIQLEPDQCGAAASELDLAEDALILRYSD